MTSAAAHFAKSRRLAVIWTVLLAFALQSYITQTHFHPLPAAAAQAAAPAGDEADACPFCEAIAVAGAFFASPPVVFGPPAVEARAAISPPALAGLLVAPAGFSWRSRAPPQA
jgi:hypothetical protein